MFQKSTYKKCCRRQKFDEHGFAFMIDEIVRSDTCEDLGGEIIIAD